MRFISIFALVHSFLFPYLAMASQSSSVLLFEKHGSNCDAKVQFLDTSKISKWFSLKTCLFETESFLFNTPQGRTLFLENGSYWSVGWNKNAKPTFLAKAYKLPVSKKALISTQSWIDKGNSKLRMAYVVEASKKLDKTEGGPWWMKKFPMLKKELSKYRGVGTLAIALVVELQADGKWKEIVAKATDSETSEAAGLSVVSAFISVKPATFSLWDLLFKTTCEGQECQPKSLKITKASQDSIKKILEPFNEDGTMDELPVAYFPMSEKDGILLRLAVVDSYFYAPPIFYCKGRADRWCEGRETITYNEDQVSISGKSPYVLVTREHVGTSAQLFRSGSKKPYRIFPKDTVVVWLELDALTDALK